MKTALALLVSGFIFLTTPLLVQAHEGARHEPKVRYAEGWQHERQGAGHYWQKRHQARDNRHGMKHANKHIREHRHYARQQRHPVSGPVVIVGLPGLVFHLDW